MSIVARDLLAMSGRQSPPRCSICKALTQHAKLCNNCWEISVRVRATPEVVAKILGMTVVKDTSVPIGEVQFRSREGDLLGTMVGLSHE